MINSENIKIFIPNESENNRLDWLGDKTYSREQKNHLSSAVIVNIAEECYWNELPLEIQIKILANLKLKSIKHMRLVSKQALIAANYILYQHYPHQAALLDSKKAQELMTKRCRMIKRSFVIATLPLTVPVLTSLTLISGGCYCFAGFAACISASNIKKETKPCRQATKSLIKINLGLIKFAFKG